MVLVVTDTCEPAITSIFAFFSNCFLVWLHVSSRKLSSPLELGLVFLLLFFHISHHSKRLYLQFCCGLEEYSSRKRDRHTKPVPHASVAHCSQLAGVGDDFSISYSPSPVHNENISTAAHNRRYSKLLQCQAGTRKTALYILVLCFLLESSNMSVSRPPFLHTAP